MNRKFADALNPWLAIFGRKIVPINIGHWYVRANILERETSQIGWRLAKVKNLGGLPDSASELDRFVVEHADEIVRKIERRRS